MKYQSVLSRTGGLTGATGTLFPGGRQASLSCDREHHVMGHQRGRHELILILPQPHSLELGDVKTESCPEDFFFLLQVDNQGWLVKLSRGHRG